MMFFGDEQAFPESPAILKDQPIAYDLLPIARRERSRPFPTKFTHDLRLQKTV